MVNRLPNGNLTWDQDGTTITVVKESPAEYGPAAATEDLQVSAANRNKAAEDAYMNSLKKMQNIVDASRPIPYIPVKPEFITVTDPYKQSDGTVTPGKQSAGPWPAPGLPDLKKKTVWPAGATAAVEEEIVVEPDVEHH